MNKGKIFVVDDDWLVFVILVYGLVQVGYDVLDVDNGDDVILLVCEYWFELVLLDICMEGLLGFDVVVYLCDYLCVFFMFLLVFFDDEMIVKVKVFGVLVYFVKLLDMQQIVFVVEVVFVYCLQLLELVLLIFVFVEYVLLLVFDQQVVVIVVGVLMYCYLLLCGVVLEWLRKFSEVEDWDLVEQVLWLVEVVELLVQLGLM